jgi:hypothetical protein
MPNAFARQLISTSLVSILLAAPVAAQAPSDAPPSSVELLPSAPVDADVVIPRRFVGRLEIASGVILLHGAAALGVLGAFLQGPPLFCGLFSDPSDDDCPPQRRGGPAFAGMAVAAVSGAALLGVGVRTAKRRHRMMRRLAEHQAFLRPSLAFGRDRSALFLEGGARF